MSLIADVRASRELLVNLTRREVKGKYKRTALGQLWSLANPLAQMLVYTLVFSVIIRIDPGPGDPSGVDVFAVWLMCALLPWTFFTGVVTGGMSSLVANENLIKKVYFPRSTLVVSNALATSYTWAIEMAVLVVAILLVGGQPLPFLPLVVLAMAVLFAFSLGVALLLSVANAYFRDMQHLVTILFQVWFYLTPILYPLSEVERRAEAAGPIVGDVTILDVYKLNPMEGFSEVFRDLLYDNRLPQWGTAVECVVWAAVALVVGSLVFQRRQRGLAEVL
ncbi:ABC transporter permease [Cellulomonas fimi]|uniref:Transport permease protein n=1 Tax=Cellulomonas fimi (strain ATCC 484 / DSM 20113 / JCM 1341 / CCUG 24087 / LMG 16345 / NBRC 15513 / NCIMB 8980 / NCTC 7547 / NRS-133) TaxID=590998 RepID=F4H537_CELFA|nr:ABC transporter permease [Cellulomonas fimi]AEE46643.1 ABC-2 type transporter [Cellulomonas fimi ATCC 484]NNH08325.1 ABC transporter permease [Cellulomonas fimi]VEH33755.1 Polysialic acid transport protein kpsM [Cellulomonas fimi]